MPRDADVITEQDLEAYTAALTRNGFFGPDSWYMNHKANGAYARASKNGGKLSMPVLFLHGAYDTTCETMTSRLAEPMRRDCADLTEVVVKSGHWMAQEQPVAVNAALAKWLAAKLPDYWRAPETRGFMRGPVAQAQHVLQRVIAFVARVFEDPIRLVLVQRKRHGPGTGVHVRIVDGGFVLNRVRVHAREALDDVSGLALRQCLEANPRRHGSRSSPFR